MHASLGLNELMDWLLELFIWSLWINSTTHGTTSSSRLVNKKIHHIYISKIKTRAKYSFSAESNENGCHPSSLSITWMEFWHFTTFSTDDILLWMSIWCIYPLLSEIHRWPADSIHQGAEKAKAFPCHDVIKPVLLVDSGTLCVTEAFFPRCPWWFSESERYSGKSRATLSQTSLDGNGFTSRDSL